MAAKAAKGFRVSMEPDFGQIEFMLDD